MSRHPILLAIIAVVIISMACSFTINIPETSIQTGATVTDDINVQLLDDADEVVDLELVFGAGELILAPGAKDALAIGTATYNVKEFKPDVTRSDNKVQIKQGETERFTTISTNVKNNWNLALGQYPMNLSITAGAYTGELELGGLSLYNLRVTEGASDTDLSFTKPNLIEMEVLRYETGASSAKLTNLANANFGRMEFKGGVGSYTLDFSGELRRDARVEIDVGLSSLVIAIPQDVSAWLTIEGALTNINTGGEWQRSGSDYRLIGDGPTITLIVKMGAGNLQLEHP
jgi:hypothetical protein